MAASNLTILTRRLWRKRSFSFVNILGLTIGITAGLLIYLLISYEWSIDRFHAKRDRIFRVVCTETFGNGATDIDGCSPIQLPAALRSEFPQVEKVAATMRMGTQRFSIPSAGGGRTDNLSSTDVYFADPTLFGIFDFPWIAGIPAKALQEPNTAAVARSVAVNWFGHWQGAIGKTILMGDGRMPFRITGILQDPPANTDIPIKIALSYATYRVMQGDNMSFAGNWDDFNSSSQCFFLLRKDQSLQSLNALLPGFVNRHFSPLYAASHVKDSCFFQPLTAMHFNTAIARYGKEGWSYNELISLGLIGIFLVAIACINFVNLSTAQSLSRSKEIGVRKILGSGKSELMLSFLAETGLLVLVSLVLSYILAAAILPFLRQLLQKPVSLSLFSFPFPGLFLLATGVAITVFAGTYPAMALSRFNPLAAIKSKTGTTSGGGTTLRRALVVFQFSIAQVLLIGTIVVLRQTAFFRTNPMGFQQNAISLVTLPRSQGSAAKYAFFKDEVLRISGVRSASLCDVAPSTAGGWWESYLSFENDLHNEDFEIEHRYADSDYLSTFRIGLVTGRYPSPSDTVREAMLNETAVKRLGVHSPDAILGKTISLEGRPDKKIPVVGVVRDFNNMPLRERLRPLAFFSAAENFGTLAIRFDPSAIHASLGRVQEIFAKIFPGKVFEAPFFDDTIAGFYHAEAITTRLFRIFAALAIFISCLGLYGLVSFMVVQKNKEVGIRKVLGASARDIVYLFSTEFTVLIGVAFVIAAPLGYTFMHSWLAGYYYHIDMGWQVFAMALVLSVLVAWASVGYSSIKAALADPVKSIGSE
jgi:ABC-type antimicrobial peptide transport system permease subunit